MSENTLVKASKTTIDDDTKAEYQREVAVLFTEINGTYHYNGSPSAVAFVDRGDTLASEYDNSEIASAMTVLAKSKGWETYKTTGNDAFYKAVERRTEQLLDEQDETNKVKPERTSDDLDALKHASALRLVHDQYRVAGSKYYFKDQIGRSNTLAFKDKGDELTSGINTERVTRSIVALAAAKGWGSVEVSGHSEFRRQVWREAVDKGIEVKGYTPTKDELVIAGKSGALQAVAKAVTKELIADESSRTKVMDTISQRINDKQGDLPTVPIYDPAAPIPERTSPVQPSKPNQQERSR